ncbi:hypothetical protein TREMEDRAFT_61544 [Tremella mesenterica DSM 1558]|uniref:uncharacterized protein n=1 Tax=Tremella mesenterica (strain ATCC 24925 / CBS 8224 / DSM 1558 / NBRC 9311 / NRRL Y-6157 / RJB 2259-6 / UBC 559-6) TaxID=578456 RepID=UPI0003F48C72|nr:uncharacterized protein TREMEDRAFT_61544 [Tremella mesenterica DSM 1558]EIW69776.1 hypothetical protein TREMEDRAFT_61544 [Tremella mesenterica DSM 1558]
MYALSMDKFSVIMDDLRENVNQAMTQPELFAPSIPQAFTDTLVLMSSFLTCTPVLAPTSDLRENRRLALAYALCSVHLLQSVMGWHWAQVSQGEGPVPQLEWLIVHTGYLSTKFLRKGGLMEKTDYGEYYARAQRL